MTDQNTIARYFHDIRNSKPLSSEKEIELAIKIQEGDQKALDELVKANLKFVVTVARKYQSSKNALEDLISEGNLGLIEAAYHFDPKAGYRFCTYAVWWIKQAILASLNNDRLIRLPVNRVGIVNQMNKVTEEYLDKEGRKPSDNELARAVGVSIDEIRTMQNATRYAIQIDMSIGDDEDSTLVDIIENPDADYADVSSLGESLVSDVDIVLRRTLSERESMIIRYSFGIDSSELNDEQIAKKFDISSERVRQIKSAALLKLRKNTKARAILREYLG